MRGDKERTGVGKAFMLKRNLTNLKALLLKRDEWVGGLGAEGWQGSPAFSCHASQEACTTAYLGPPKSAAQARVLHCCAQAYRHHLMPLC